MEDLKLLKSYLRIDGSEDDDVLAFLVGAAEEDLAISGVKKPEAGSESKLYEQAIILSVNKGRARDEKELERIEKSLASLILKLKDWRETT